jgi:hypothetical protein
MSRPPLALPVWLVLGIGDGGGSSGGEEAHASSAYVHPGVFPLAAATIIMVVVRAGTVALTAAARRRHPARR